MSLKNILKSCFIKNLKDCSFIQLFFFRTALQGSRKGSRLGSGQALRHCSGQAIVEYFILLVLLAAISIIGSSVFFSRTQGSVKNFEGNCFEAMGQEYVDFAEWGEEEKPWWDVEVMRDGESSGDENNDKILPSDFDQNW